MSISIKNKLLPLISAGVSSFLIKTFDLMHNTNWDLTHGFSLTASTLSICELHTQLAACSSFVSKSLLFLFINQTFKQLLWTTSRWFALTKRISLIRSFVSQWMRSFLNDMPSESYDHRVTMWLNATDIRSPLLSQLKSISFGDRLR